MRLFLLLLHFFLVLPTSQRQLDASETYAHLKGGFPVGSLLTIYLKYTAQPEWKNSVLIELFENFTSGKGQLQFRVYRDDVIYPHVSSVISKTDTMKENEKTELGIFHTKERQEWWRFDLYKIDDSRYLPFLQGFDAHVRTMAGVNNVRTVHLTSRESHKLNYDKDDVYMNRRLPRTFTPKKENVIAALAPDAANVEFLNALTFAVGQKLKLSVLMRSAKLYNEKFPTDKNHATLYFTNAGGTWAFGICNKWDETVKKVKLYLFADNTIAQSTGKVWPTSTQWPIVKDCTGSLSSTDLVHLKLERPDKKTIKMRVYYKGPVTGVTCDITIPDPQVVNLDGPLKVLGTQGATLLHINV